MDDVSRLGCGDFDCSMLTVRCCDATGVPMGTLLPGQLWRHRPAHGSAFQQFGSCHGVVRAARRRYDQELNANRGGYGATTGNGNQQKVSNKGGDTSQLYPAAWKQNSWVPKIPLSVTDDQGMAQTRCAAMPLARCPLPWPGPSVRGLGPLELARNAASAVSVCSDSSPQSTSGFSWSMLVPKPGNQFHMFVGSFVRCFVESVLISLLGVSRVCWSESQLLDGSNSLLISL